MAIITISRGSHSSGKEVAEKLAKKLGYMCISREILLDASEHFNVPEIKLTKAVHDAPSFFDRFSYGKEKYMAYIQAELLKYLREDNIVYHGLAGHFFVKNISHAFKIRIIADIEYRKNLFVQRNKVSDKEAEQIIKQDDEQRRKWSHSIYGIDTTDASLYDMVLHIQNLGLGIEEAVDIIYNASLLPTFKATEKSKKAIYNLSLAADVKAALIHLTPNLEVCAEGYKVFISLKSQLEDTRLASEVEKIAKEIRNVKEVTIKILPVTIYN